MRIKSFIGSSIIATLGGLIGLGGAEFRLPFLVGILKIATLQAVMINIVISLVTVGFALLFRGIDDVISSYLYIIFNLLAGTLIGAWLGANYASGIDKHKLNRYIFVLLIFLSFLLFSHLFFKYGINGALLGSTVQIFIGFVLGIGIGAVSSLLGVAGGEMLIPLIVLLYGVDIKSAGTLSLAISLPTLLVGLYRYYSNGKLLEILPYKVVVAYMSIGSIVGAFIGSLLVGHINAIYIQILLGAVLLVSAFKLFRQRGTE